MCRKVILYVLLFWGLISRSEVIINITDSAYKSTDSCIVFVSTRHSTFSDGRYWFGTKIEKDNKLKFYNIYFKSGVRRVAPRRSLSEAIGYANVSPDFVVYTEGHGKKFSDNVERGVSTSRIYGVSIIMFDWPSSVPAYGVERNFYTSIHNSKSVSKQFNDLLIQLGKYKKDPANTKIKHLSLFFHSMGNYVLISTLKRYGCHHYDKDLVDNIIFNAPCVPARGHDKWIDQLTFQKNIYVTYNKKDPALKGASFLLGKFLLGTHPIRVAKNAKYLDLKPVAKVSHNYFLRQSLLISHPKVQDIYNNLFHSRTLDLNDVCIGSGGGTNKFCVF